MHHSCQIMIPGGGPALLLQNEWILGLVSAGMEILCSSSLRKFYAGKHMKCQSVLPSDVLCGLFHAENRLDPDAQTHQLSRGLCDGQVVIVAGAFPADRDKSGIFEYL